MKHAFKFTLNMGVYDGKCTQCGQDYRVKVTTQCPEAKLCDDIAKRVQAGQLDFRNNTWINSKLPNNTGDMARDDYVAPPKQDVSEIMNSFVEFMKAIEEELSPEASDELTDKDIDLLKNINSVPLPVSCVSKLELPVDQLVSLHKLKRLNYVWFNGLTCSYMIRDKGEELLDSLKPKPVKLDVSKLQVLVYMYRKTSISRPTSLMKDDFEWLLENTRFIYPDVKDRSKWALTPVGKEFIDEILSKELLFI